MKIRSYASEDLIGIERLFADRELPFDKELFLWKKKAPNVFSWVGERDGTLAAHYSIIEMPMFPGFRTGVAVDGIFARETSQVPNIAKMLNHAMQETRGAGIDIVIGVPNKRMGPVKRLLGWSTAPTYRWEISRGAQLVTKAASLQDSLSGYDDWRLTKGPRKYGMDPEGNLIVSEEMQYKGAPYLIRYNLSKWPVIGERYSFSYLRKQPGNSPDVEPLYVLLNKASSDTSLEWPDVWPMETLEGVVLGW
ncbi:hypothetical protein QYF50_01030 [Paenibacillus vini]|uniref:hypothetical protein n=1 Tax=Paenibacillus vini TaxID=1476024 RepID=UPI0025B6C34F|nr:hypothetical protein [Paenibacillus vini]MDN4066460.1 hypothetical protein [Paenibacillus vini]